MLICPFETWCVWKARKSIRGTQAFKCAYDNVWAVSFTFAVVLVFIIVLWSGICELQVCFHSFHWFVHQLDWEVGMQVVDGEVRLA